MHLQISQLLGLDDAALGASVGRSVLGVRWGSGSWDYDYGLGFRVWGGRG